MKRFALCVVVACVFLCAGMAQAASKPGMYASVSGGWTTVSDDLKLTDLEGDNTGPLPDQELSLDDGFGMTVAVGYNFGAVRLEGEGGYRNNNVDELKSGGVRVIGGDADFQAFSLMVNAIAEAPLGDRFFIYGGVGGGLVVADMETRVPGVAESDIVAGALAYQLMAGVGVNLSDQVALTVGYRLFSAFDSDFDNEDIDESDNDELEGSMNFPVIHCVEVGLRYTF